jgi:hypothetical protein
MGGVIAGLGNARCNIAQYAVFPTGVNDTIIFAWSLFFIL